MACKRTEGFSSFRYVNKRDFYPTGQLSRGVEMKMEMLANVSRHCGECQPDHQRSESAKESEEEYQLLKQTSAPRAHIMQIYIYMLIIFYKSCIWLGVQPEIHRPDESLVATHPDTANEHYGRSNVWQPERRDKRPRPEGIIL